MFIDLTDEGGLFLVHALFPGELLLYIACQRHAAAVAFRQLRCVPCAALGTFHSAVNLRKHS